MVSLFFTFETWKAYPDALILCSKGEWIAMSTAESFSGRNFLYVKSTFWLFTWQNLQEKRRRHFWNIFTKKYLPQCYLSTEFWRAVLLVFFTFLHREYQNCGRWKIESFFKINAPFFIVLIDKTFRNLAQSILSRKISFQYYTNWKCF